MANHPSARKRARQNKKRRSANIKVKGAVKTALKRARGSVASADSDAQSLARRAESALRTAASRGVIPKRRASRQISRLMKSLKRES